MKRNKIIVFLFSALFFLVIGCSKKDNPASSNNTGGIGGIGGTTGGTVAFEIRTQQGQNGGSEFDAKPSADVTIHAVYILETTTAFADTLQDDGTTVYPKDQWVGLTEYTGVTSGMHFKFNFIGKTSPDAKDFNVTKEYDIP